MYQDSPEELVDLLAQRRFGQAQYELRRLLEADPDNAPTRSLLALCLVELGHREEATEQARRAAHAAPDEAYCRWILGLILVDRYRYREALPEARAATRLEPEDPDHHSLLARCHAGLGRWDDALAAAEAGLALDPEDQSCANLRALALQLRGHSEEADQAFVDAAALDPDNAFARAGRGWASLRRGGPPGDALSHFYHALQIDPDAEWARTGMLAALKARNPLYRLMLRYFLWMESLSGRTRLLVVVGGVLCYGQLRRLADSQPRLAPFIYPVLALYLLFLLLSWTADPLFDFVLRFDPQGRALVPRDRRVAAGWVVGALVVALASLALALAGVEPALMLALVAGVLVIPISGTFQCPPGRPRRVMAAYTAVLGTAGLLGVLLPDPPAGVLLMVSVVGAVVASWLARWLAARVPVR